MTSVEILDRSGNIMQAVDINGRLFPPSNPDVLIGASKMAARPDDVLLCAYPKSGSHWVYEITRFLMAGTTDLPLKEKFETFIEFSDPGKLDALPSPRLLNTHYHFDTMSPDFLRQRCKIIHVTRDPRDVAVSGYNHYRYGLGDDGYKGEWGDFLPLVLEGKVGYESWFKYTKGWEEGMAQHPDHPFLVLTYEAMKHNLLKEVKRLANFLEIQCSEAFLQEVAEKTDFDAMKKRRQTVESHPFIFVYRKGQTGDWKNHFTVAQSEMFDEKFEDEMPGTSAYELYTHSRP